MHVLSRKPLVIFQVNLHLYSRVKAVSSMLIAFIVTCGEPLHYMIPRILGTVEAHEVNLMRQDQISLH